MFGMTCQGMITQMHIQEKVGENIMKLYICTVFCIEVLIKKD